MFSHVPLLAGVVAGLSIAVPVGPTSLLCIRRTLAGGMRAGLCTGLGAATVNVAFGALILGGLDRTGMLAAGFGRALSFAGGVFLLWSAARILVRPCVPGGPVRDPGMSPVAAYGTAVVFNATNPLSPMLTLALLAPVVAQGSPSAAGASLLLVGMFAGATAWWTCLTGCVGLLRSRLSPHVLAAVNQAAAGMLTFYGALALARAAGISG